MTLVRPAPNPTPAKAPAKPAPSAMEAVDTAPPAAPSKPEATKGPTAAETAARDAAAQAAVTEISLQVGKDAGLVLGGGSPGIASEALAQTTSLLEQLATSQLDIRKLSEPTFSLDTSGPPKGPPEGPESTATSSPEPKGRPLRTAADIALAGENPVQRPTEETSAQPTAEATAAEPAPPAPEPAPPAHEAQPETEPPADMGELVEDVGADISAVQAEQAQQPAPEQLQPVEPGQSAPEVAQGLTERDINLIHSVYGRRARDLLMQLVGIDLRNLKNINMEALLKGKKAGLMHFMDALVVANADLTPGSAGSEYSLGVLERSQDPAAKALADKLRAQLGDHHPLAEMARKNGLDDLAATLENPDATPEAHAQAVDATIKHTVEKGNYKALGTIMSELTGGRLGSRETQDPHSGTKYIVPDVEGWMATLPLEAKANPAEYARKLQKVIYEAQKVGLLDKAKGMAGKSIMIILVLLAALSMSMQMVQGQEGGHQ